MEGELVTLQDLFVFEKKGLTETGRCGAVSGPPASGPSSTSAADPIPGGAQLLRNLAGKRPQLEVWLEHLALLEKTKKLIQQAGVNWTPGGLILTMAGGVVGAMALARLLPALFVYGRGLRRAGGVFLAALPYLYLRRKRARRWRPSKSSFPKLSTFWRAPCAPATLSPSVCAWRARICPTRWAWNSARCSTSRISARRSIRRSITWRSGSAAGCAFLRLGGDPAETNRRQPGRDPHPFGQVIRQRFQLKGQVKAASAHGRITALVLTILPAATVSS
jgi:hypothetical protein